MAVGLISKEEFMKKAQLLQRRSQFLNDGWNCIKIRDDVVLCKTVTQQVAYGGQKGIQDIDIQRGVDAGTEDLEDMTDSLDEETDTACLTVDTPTMSDILQFEYHVVYNESYSVPVLYLNVTRSDGKLISLEELWDLIPTVYRDRLEADKWTFLTQQEHPLLGRPFYQLHPCHTEKLMSIMQTQYSSEDSNTRFVVCGKGIKYKKESIEELPGLMVKHCRTSGEFETALRLWEDYLKKHEEIGFQS